VKIRRDVGSIPLRTAEATWDTIQTLLTGPKSIDAQQFSNARSVMSSLITDEIFKAAPITLAGKSLRVVVYLIHGTDALETSEDISSLPESPTEQEWNLYFECPDEQYDWVKKTLAIRAARFTVLREGELANLSANSKNTGKQSFEVNWGALQNG
jgi:hypothetical protein